MNRRDFLKSCLAGSVALLTPQLVFSAEVRDINSYINDQYFWSLPRSVKLYRVATNQAEDLVYYENGQLIYENYIKLCYLLRDVRANKIYSMDFQLLNLIRATQYYLEYHYGYRDFWHVTSAYRTEETNSSLEGAARNSMHLQGKAIDFVVPGIKSIYMGLIAKSYSAGGVGFYINKNFTHIDTGINRHWVG